MNVSTEKPKVDPDGYNPPSLFSGLNMSVNSGAEAKNKPSEVSSTTHPNTTIAQTPVIPQNQPTAPGQFASGSPFGNQPGTSSPFGNQPGTSSPFGTNPVAQNPAPVQNAGPFGVQSTGGTIPNMQNLAGDPNSIFFGMSNTSKSFENNEASAGIVNTSTDHVSNRDSKLDNSRTADDSSKDFANLSRISQNDGPEPYTPPLFENMTVSPYHSKPNELENPVAHPVEKVNSTPPTGPWSSYKKDKETAPLKEKETEKVELSSSSVPSLPKDKSGKTNFSPFFGSFN